jgi:glycosyltransferase involved in cell wall biosynthesis
VICGRQTRTYSNLPVGVEFLGFVEHLDEFYADIDAVLSPSFVPGGVKTKVYEAFSYGVPVIGNKITFSGIDLPSYYPYVFTKDELMSFLSRDFSIIRFELLEFLSTNDMRDYCHGFDQLKKQLVGLCE